MAFVERWPFREIGCIVWPPKKKAVVERWPLVEVRLYVFYVNGLLKT